MFRTTAPDSVAGNYVDKNLGTNTPGTKIIADDQNRNQEELANAVEKSGQALDATGVDLSQLARALTIAGQVSVFCEDSGAADAYVLSLANTTIEPPTSYNQLDGALFLFTPATPNTGIAATIDFEGLGAKSLTDKNGGLLDPNDISGSVLVTFNPSNDRFEFFMNNAQATLATESSAGIAEIATQAEVDNGTDDQTIVTPLKLQNKINDNVIGINQSYANVIGSRTSGVIYTNTTGKTIFVVFTVLGLSVAETVNVEVDGSIIIEETNDNTGGVCYAFLVPSGSTYEVTTNGTIQSWTELRA